MASKVLEEALALHKAGRLLEAETAYRAIIANDPAAADAYHFLGLVEAGTGRMDAAEASIGEAVALQPKRPTFHYNLGYVLQELDRLVEALDHYQRSLALEPNQPAAHYNSGLVLSRLYRFGEAEQAFEAAVALQPNYAEAWGNLGAARRSLGDNVGAIEACKKALAINPGQAEVLATLGNAVKENGDYDGAIDHYQAAIKLAPNFVTAHFNLGNILIELGQSLEGRKALEHAVSLDPSDQSAQDNLLMSRLNDPGETEQSLYEAHVAAVKHLPPPATSSKTERRPIKQLKIGFVSADFRRHSCAYFFEPLLKSLDRSSLQIYAYAMVANPDEVTARLKGFCDGWTDAIALSDDEFADKIGNDKIDILIDLSGHTSGNRLSVFNRKPAPVQVSWLGYPATSGLSTIDARFTDAIADPAGDADQWHSEGLIRLPNSFLLYGAPSDAPAVEALPAETNGFITFGSFNNLSKVNSLVIQSWCRILTSVPGSRLMLKGRTMGSPGVRERLMAQFNQGGIEADRLKLIEWVPRNENPLELYNQMDIALDTFPYNGTTTTCEALWMGVPVISFKGNRHAGRVGGSLLTSVGLTDCLTDDLASYEQAAARLASTPERLNEIRQILRQQMASSPLCNGATFARDFVTALRSLLGE